MKCKLAAVVIAALAMLDAADAHARAAIAITFDDLPALTLSHDQRYVTDLNTMILRGLNRHHIPATGFVNESKLDQLGSGPIKLLA